MPRSAVVSKFGGPDVFRFVDTPPRSPGEGEVRISVSFAGVNFADIAARSGFYDPAPQPPFVLGFEVSGTIAEVGPRVPGFGVGDQVLAVTRFGGYTTDLIADASRVRELPAGMSLEQGAGLPAVYLTAYHGLTEVARVRRGESVLIHACAGGVGTALIQVSKALGLTAYGTASTDEKIAFAKNNGLDFGVNYSTEEFAPAIRTATEGRGVDVVFDANGGRSFAESYRCLAPGGRLVVYGAASLMPEKWWELPRSAWRAIQQKRFAPMNLIERNVGVLGLQVLLLWDELEKLGAEMDALLGMFKKGALNPVIDRVFDLEELGAAHQYLLERKSKGKVLLRMPGTSERKRPQ
jgi:NADPH:quinone reductase-like Zn-dependent oxidoreductase